MIETKTDDYIIKISIPFEKELCGIYFLLDNYKIVYVGQTTQGLSRTLSHIRDKKFDRYSYIPIKKELLNQVELFYIIMFKPKYNKTFFQNSISFTSMKTKLRTLGLIHNIKIIKKILKELNQDVLNITKNKSISIESFYILVNFLIKGNKK